MVGAFGGVAGGRQFLAASGHSTASEYRGDNVSFGACSTSKPADKSIGRKQCGYLWAGLTDSLAGVTAGSSAAEESLRAK